MGRYVFLAIVEDTLSVIVCLFRQWDWASKRTHPGSDSEWNLHCPWLWSHSWANLEHCCHFPLWASLFQMTDYAHTVRRRSGASPGNIPYSTSPRRHICKTADALQLVLAGDEHPSEGDAKVMQGLSVLILSPIRMVTHSWEAARSQASRQWASHPQVPPAAGIKGQGQEDVQETVI